MIPNLAILCHNPTMNFIYADQVPGCPGIQRMRLNTKELYLKLDEYGEFEARLAEFLKIDNKPKVIEYSENILSYETESVIPTMQDSRPPLLLLLGNPAPDSVRRRCFFAGEKGKEEHRFWPILAKAGIVSFKNFSEEVNTARTRALFGLDYESPFRIGLAVFYSMPSPASAPKWSGVAGLRKLFRAEALRKIAEWERKRVDGLIDEFVAVNPDGAVIAFQKDAYMGVKDNKSQESVVARKGERFAVEARCSSSGVRLFRMPPTRYMNASWYMSFMQNVGELNKRQTKRFISP